MKIIKRIELAASAAGRWSDQYGPNFDTFGALDKKAIHENLLALGENPSVVDVNKTIGNTSWTRATCGECQVEGFDEVIMVGEEPDYESSTACLCKSCLQSALRIFNHT